DELSAVTVLLQALFDAADDDAATSGLDLTRGILPVVMRASHDGVAEWDAEGVRAVAEDIVAERAKRHDGPRGAAL
ncbi:MAG: proteasome subunit beta, partial [Propionibacterium sp.]|nr:proteasome subunit beta [Propionibacterium sp.]